MFSKVDPSIPLVCVCGNHDVGNKVKKKISKKKFIDHSSPLNYLSIDINQILEMIIFLFGPTMFAM